MDFETLPIDRRNLRFLAKMLRKNFKIKTLEFPVLKFLEKIHLISRDCCKYVVDEDSKFEPNVMAYLEYTNGTNDFVIHIRESVYIKAYSDDHASIGFIMHEISHYLLIGVLGIKPINTSITYTTKGIPAFRSAEWQAKAFCGEIMIPYDICKDMSFDEIYEKTKSSKEQTNYFLKNIVKKEQ